MFLSSMKYGRFPFILSLTALLLAACGGAPAGSCQADEGCLFSAGNGNRNVRVIGYSADGSRFLTDGLADGRIHDASNGNRVGSLDEGTENHSYVIAADGQEIVAHRGDSVKFFDWEGELLRTWTPDADDQVRDVTTLPLVNGFAVIGERGISLWSMSDGSLITRLDEQPGFLHLASSADGEVLVGYNFMNDELYVWPLQDLDRMLVIPDVEALAIALNADGSRVAAGGPPGSFVWDTQDGSLLTAVTPDDAKGTTMGFSADGTQLAAAFETGDVLLVDVDANSLIKTFTLDAVPDNVRFSPDSSQLAVGLDPEVTVSDGGLVFDNNSQAGGAFQSGGNIRISDNRISVEPGYALVFSLASD